MAKLVKAVVEHTFRFSLYKPDGTPSDIIVALRAESEEAARLKLPQSDKVQRDWRLIATED